MTHDPTSLAGDCAGSRDRLRHFRLQSAEVDGGGAGPGRYSCQLYRSFVDVCRPHRAAADGSPTPPNGACDVIKTVTSSSAGSGITAAAAASALNCGAIECPECLAESGRTLHSPGSENRFNTVGPLAAAAPSSRRHPCSTITV